MREFVNHNGPTDDGKAVLAALEQLAESAGTDPVKLNQLPGHVQHYIVNVRLMGTLTQEQWLRDYPGQATLIAERLTEAAARAQKTTEAIEDTLDTKIAALEQRLMAKLGLTESETPPEPEPPAPKGKAKAEKKSEPPPEPDDAPESDEDEDDEG